MSNTKNKIKKLTTVAVLTALAFITVAYIRIPITTVDFLKYEPKDVIITVAGFVFGPLSAVAMSVAVSFIEMVTISSTGIWGFLMNVLSTSAFACTASFIYRKKKSAVSALIGLICGVVMCASLMVLWNWLVTPFYMGTPREAVAAMLIPVFLPFNLIKCGLNAAFTLIIYKPAILALRRADLVDDASLRREAPKSFAAVVCVAVVAAVSLVLVALTLTGVI